MKKRITAAFIAILISAALPGQSQTEGLGSWSVANIRHSFTRRWLIWTELQLRSYRFYNDFFYHEVKGGFQYNLSDDVNFLIGTGQYTTYSTQGNFKSPVVANETRFWEQLGLNNNLGPIKIEHRYRVEQRWLNSGYRNRFRYRINPIIALGKPKLQPHTFFITAFDEIFLTNKAPHFERNRVFGGIGYQFSKVFTLQTGYVNQYDYRANGTSVSNNFLQTTLFLNFRSADTKREYHPSTMD